MQALNNRRAGFCSRMNKADGLAGGRIGINAR